MLSILSFFSNPFGFVQRIVFGAGALAFIFTFGAYEGRKYTLASEAAKYEMARQAEEKHQIEVQLQSAERETELIKKNQDLESLVNDLTIKSTESPTAGSVSLPTDSVRRLDEIR
jgi:hypothetical protein